MKMSIQAQQVTARIATRMCGRRIQPADLPARVAILDAVDDDAGAVMKRVAVMSSGEKLVAAALLSDADHAELADNLVEGAFLARLPHCSGAHREAVLVLLA